MASSGSRSAAVRKAWQSRKRGGVLGASARNPGQRAALASFIKEGKFHGVKGAGVRHRLGNVFSATRRQQAGVLKAIRGGDHPAELRAVIRTSGTSVKQVNRAVRSRKG